MAWRSYTLPLSPQDFGKPADSVAERLRVIEKMTAHSQYCVTGDTTLEATKIAVRPLDNFVRRLPTDPHSRC